MGAGPVLAVVRLEESSPRTTAFNRTNWEHPVEGALLVPVRPTTKMSDVDDVLAFRDHRFEKGQGPNSYTLLSCETPEIGRTGAALSLSRHRHAGRSCAQQSVDSANGSLYSWRS